MRPVEFLDDHHVDYALHQHGPTFTAQQLASAEDVSGIAVAKPVLVKTDDCYYMCVLPASRMIDFDALQSAVGGRDVWLVPEREMSRVFKDCELGAEPPFGNMYGMETLMDESLQQDENIVFQAGRHNESICMSLYDYKTVAHPRILSFSYRQINRQMPPDGSDYDPFFYDPFFYPW